MSPSDGPPADARPPAASGRVYRANLLFLISIVLVMTLGGLAQLVRIWPGLIFTELFCVLLPAFLFARRTGPVAEVMRLRWLGLLPFAIGILTGAAAFPLAISADAIGERILGYGYTMPDSAYPTGAGAVAVYLLALVILPPVCEEALFRGYILGACEAERWASRRAVVYVAMLCTAWHLSPSRAPGVAIFALLTTYLASRTGSVWPAIGAHMGANGTAASLALLRTTLPGDGFGLRAFLLAALSAVIVAALCDQGIRRWAVQPSPEKSSAEFPRPYWPLTISAVLVFVVSIVEMAAGVSRRGMGR